MILPTPITAAFDAIKAASTSIITGLCVAAICLPLGYCKGETAATAKWEAARDLANVKAMKTDAKAKDNAAAARVTDALTVKENEKELLDAIADIPDEQPSAVRVAAGCQRLHAQGTDITSIPACRGS